MVQVHLTTNLAAGSPSIKGWETCATTAGSVVLLTGNVEPGRNVFTAFSLDGGGTFAVGDPWTLCANHSQNPAGDQVVIYADTIDTIVWLIQTVQGNYVLAVATPVELAQGAWTTYLLTGGTFVPGGSVDYPEVAIGNSYLYLAFNVSTSSVGVRIPLEQIRARAALDFQFFLPSPAVWWMRPVQHPGPDGWFVVQRDASALRVYRWPEGSSNYTWFDVPIRTIPGSDFEMPTPGGDVWLHPGSKVDWHLYGATLARGKIWVAWNGGRRIGDDPEIIYPHPHIGLAIIDPFAGVLSGEQAIWHPDFAFAWPSLATNSNGEVGMSFCWGGGAIDPQYAVGILSRPGRPMVTISQGGPTTGAGGHYTSVRRMYPDQERFCGSGWAQVKVGPQGVLHNHPYYTVFSPDPVTPQINIWTEDHQLGGYIHLKGNGFAPNGEARIEVIGVFAGPSWIGSVGVGPDGRFGYPNDYIIDARIHPGHQNGATIRVIDTATGLFAEGQTDAYHDPA